LDLLRENKIDRHCKWTDAKKQVDTDQRYKIIGDSALREKYFHDYCRIIKDEKRKIKKDKKSVRNDKKLCKTEFKDDSCEKDGGFKTIEMQSSCIIENVR
jgi:FF domain